MICRHGFVPHPRVGDRQRACGEPACQRARRKRNQDDWRGRHPGYFIEWRARERAGRGESNPIEPPRLAPPLSQLPWAFAQKTFGIEGSDFLGSLGRILVRHAKDEIRRQPTGSTRGSTQVAQAVAKDEIPGQGRGSTGDLPQVGQEAAKDEIPGVSG